MSYIPIIILLIGGLILTIGDIIMKKWIITNSIYTYILGIGIWLIGLNFLAQSFKYKNIAVASVIFVIFNVVILAIVSWFYFKETLSIWQIMGIVLGLTSVILLEFSP